MSAILENLQAVRDSIATAERAAARAPHSVILLAVSKNFGADAVLDAMQAGQHAFGENYVQEAIDKMAQVEAALMTQPELAPSMEWHFIGPIQSNKTRQIATHFDWVHSVERQKIASRLSEQRPAHLGPLNVCLQVNISGEASKSGVAVHEVSQLAHQVAAMPNLRLRGLMAIPEPAASLAQQRQPFHQMRILYESLQAEGLKLDTLSMGMSDDMTAAIAEGATMVRIGTAIFGKRNYAK